MASDRSLEGYAGKAVGRYSSLFTLPSHAKVVLLLLMVCLSGGFLAVLPLKQSPFGVAAGLLLGAAFLFITLSADLAVHYSCMRVDPIMNLRRSSALSLFSCLVWFAFLSFGGIAGGLLGSPNLWARLFLLGFCAALTLRLLVYSTVSSAGWGKVFFSSIVQPTLCAIPLFFIGPTLGYELNLRLLLFLPLSILLVVLVNSLFVASVNHVGEKNLGVASLPLFRAFLANWMEGLNEPLETLFERLGLERSIKVSLLAFRSSGRVKAVIVVPAVHPGPFRNVGSSPLPHMIQAALEDKLRCVVSVPHGLSKHGLNLTSQLQNRKVVRAILGSIGFSAAESKATPPVQVQMDGAKANCQIFGDCALIALTIAPQTMEDLPPELDLIITNEAEKHGLSAIVIDAHNSLEGQFNPEGVVEPFKKAAVKGLEEALHRQRSPFEVGAAKVVPEEFGVEEGMGPGGISVLVIRVGGQKTAYVTIDGNNMVSGLREKILRNLREVGIVDGEVLTTDTHLVAGVALTERGYHPVGEAIDQAALTSYVRQAAITASNDLEPAEVSWRIITVPNVKVIGEKHVETLCLVTEETAKKSKKLAVSLFSVAGVLLTAMLAFL